MNEFLDHLSANDNDIYDLLISGKQRLTDSILRDFAKDRGIFCSKDDTREDLSDYLSILPHGFHDVAVIIQKREPSHHKEKSTFVRLNAEISIAELKDATQDYIASNGSKELVQYRPSGTGGFIVNVAYSEFNRSRARMLQREKQTAEIEFIIENGQAVIRFPATDKAKRIIAALKENLERRRKAKINEESIELTGLTTPELRSRFFTKLISSLSDYKLRNVMSLKVSSDLSEKGEDDEALDLESQEENDASAEMFAAVVHSMQLSGQNLVQSQEYKDLISRGFYITAISWRSEFVGSPPDIIQFDAGFQDRKNGTGFKYSIQGTFKSHKGIHRKTLISVSDTEKSILLSLVESTARSVLEALKSESNSPLSADDGGADDGTL